MTEPFNFNVRQLLTLDLSTIEAMWDQNPECQAIAYALTVKEYMIRRGLRQAEMGIRSYEAYKRRQSTMLSSVGLHTQRDHEPSDLVSPTPRLLTSPA